MSEKLREIRFRGVDCYYNKANKASDYCENLWRYGSLMVYDNGDIGIARGEKHGYMTITSKVIPKTVGQYTGLKDSNGTDIYEGDILNFPEIGRVVVEFRRGVFGAGYGTHGGFSPLLESLWGYRNDPMLQPYGITIQGNTYDNPELLQ